MIHVYDGISFIIGADMANAFIEYLWGADTAKKIRGITELSVHAEDDDEYAEFHGLV